MMIFLGLLLSVAAQAQEQEPPKVVIDPAHQTCQTDNDCVLISVKCNSIDCECGDPVNKEYFDLYKKLVEECRGDGPLAICDFYCATPYPKCVENMCVRAARE